MAGSTPFVLPQYQGSMYDLQRQQALANALMQGAMTQPQAPASGTSGQYTVAAHTSPLAPLSNIAQGLMANRIGQQAGQGMNALGQQQFQGLMSMLGGGAGQSPQLSPGSADGGVGGAAAGSVANPFAGSDGGDGSAGAAASGPVNGVSAGPPGPQLANNVGGGQGGGSPLNPLGMNPGMAAMMMMQSPDKYWEAQAGAYKPSDIVAQIRAAGIDPNSTLGHQLAQQALAKANYIAPVSARPGGALMMPNGEMRYTVPAPQQGGMWATNADGSLKLNQAGQPYQVAIGGAGEIEGGMAYQKAAGEGGALPYAGFDQQGNPLPVTNRTAAATQGNGSVPLPLRNNNPGAVSPGGTVAQYPDMQTGLAAMDKNLANYANDPKVKTVGDAITKWVGVPSRAPAYIQDVSTRLGIAPNTPVDLTNPAQRQAIGTAIMLHESGPSAVFAQSQKGAAPQAAQPSPAAQQPQQPTSGAIYAQPQPGFNQGQQDLQTDLTKKWGTLNEANSQAQNTISYLSNIRGLASKAALGQQSDKINFVNGLLSLAGSEKATDAVTANNLLDKYSNQIVARLGTGGLGTDAARSILQSAYPNAHMTQGAIGEAVDNLVGASQMTQAKARLLQGDYNARNPQAYNQKEMTFDQNADPRIWQFQNMNPQQRAAFKASMTPQEQQQFGLQIRNLVQLGVLK